MARIRRAQAKGKTDVRLSKEELAAYQRRLERMEVERRQRRERVAIPLSQLDPSSRQKRLSLEDDSPPRRASPELGEERSPGHPPMGYFPPPSRARQPSGTASSRPPSQAATERDQSSSPFTYSYVNAPSALRHPSDPVTSRPLSVAESVSARNGSSPSVAGQFQGLDPFQYMTTGARTSYHAGAASHNSIVDVDDIYASYGSAAPAGASRRRNGEHRDGESSNEDDGMLRVSSGSRSRPRDRSHSRRELASEPKASRDRTPPPSKKSSSVQSPVRRKAVATTKSGRKKTK
ncbi:hypothetical protein VTI74DRAFT_9372 [Chaetomium olivicolor]